MIRFLIRALGYLALAGAFVSAAVDGTRSIASSALTLTSVGAGLDRVAPTAQAWLKASLSGVHPALWENAGEHLMRVPLSVVLVCLGVLLVWLATEPEESIGYDARA